MAKNNTQGAHVEKLRLNEGLEEALLEHPSVLWLRDHGKKIGYALLALLLVSILLYRLLASQNARADQDYFTLAEIAAVIDNPETPSEKRSASLNQLQNLVSAYPQLQTKYDGLIGEQLLLAKRAQEATPYIERTFARVDGAESQNYLSYAANSLLIAENKPVEALKSARALREQILKDASPFSGVLYAFNLIRVALLEKQLSQPHPELNAWSELQKMGTPDHPIKISAQDLKRVMAHFDSEEASLSAFINPKK